MPIARVPLAGQDVDVVVRRQAPTRHFASDELCGALAGQQVTNEVDAEADRHDAPAGRHPFQVIAPLQETGHQKKPPKIRLLLLLLLLLMMLLWPSLHVIPVEVQLFQIVDGPGQSLAGVGLEDDIVLEDDHFFELSLYDLKSATTQISAKSYSFTQKIT